MGVLRWLALVRNVQNEVVGCVLRGGIMSEGNC